MADVAQLGLSVDSSQVRGATAALNQMSAASKTAEDASQRLTTASGQAGASMRTIESMAKRAGVSVEEMKARVQAASDAHLKMNQASQTAVRGMTQLSTQAVKASNDNDALGKTTDRTTGSLERFATRFTRGLITGVVLASVRELTRYLFDLNAQLAATADTAQRVGIGSQQYQGLQTAAAYKGIGNADFNTAMLAFNQQVDLARSRMGDLYALLRLNGKTVSDTATTFETIADLVKNAGSEAQKFSILQSAGLPATREYVKLMEQGAEKIRLQASFSSKLTDQQLADAKRINQEWQRAWTDFENWGKRASVNVFTFLRNNAAGFTAALTNTNLEDVLRRKGIEALKSGQGSPLAGQRDDSIKTIYNSTGAFGTEATSESSSKDLERRRRELAIEQQRLALLSPLATAIDVRRQAQNELNIADANGIRISGTQAKALIDLRVAQFEMSKVQQQASLGIFDATAAQKAFNDQLQAMIAQKLIDPTNVQQMAAAHVVLAKQLRETSDAARVAASNFPQLQQAINDAGNSYKQMDSFALSGVDKFSSAFADAATGAKSFKDAFKDMASSIIYDLIRIQARNSILSALGGGSSGGGLLSLFGLGGGGGGSALPLPGQGSFIGPVASANGNVFSGGNVVPFANGGLITRPTLFPMANGGTGLAGEAGDEAIMPLTRIGGKLGVRSAGGGGQVVMNDNRVIHIGQGASQETVAQLRQELAMDRATRYRDTVEIVQTAKKRRQL